MSGEGGFQTEEKCNPKNLDRYADAVINTDTDGDNVIDRDRKR